MGICAAISVAADKLGLAAPLCTWECFQVPSAAMAAFFFHVFCPTVSPSYKCALPFPEQFRSAIGKPKLSQPEQKRPNVASGTKETVFLPFKKRFAFDANLVICVSTDALTRLLTESSKIPQNLETCRPVH